MDIQKQHEYFCKVFKPEFGTIFNIDSIQFEPLEDKYYQDAQRLNWAFAGWLQAAKAKAVPEGFVLIPKKLPDELNDQLWDFMTDNFVCVNDDGDSFMACDDFDLDKLYAELIESQESK